MFLICLGIFHYETLLNYAEGNKPTKKQKTNVHVDVLVVQ